MWQPTRHTHPIYPLAMSTQSWFRAFNFFKSTRQRDNKRGRGTEERGCSRRLPRKRHGNDGAWVQRPKPDTKHDNRVTYMFACVGLKTIQDERTRTHLIAHSRMRAPAAHARPAPAAVVPAENEVERAGAHHAPGGHRVWHPELLVRHLSRAVHDKQNKREQKNKQ